MNSWFITISVPVFIILGCSVRDARSDEDHSDQPKSRQVTDFERLDREALLFFRCAICPEYQAPVCCKKDVTKYCCRDPPPCPNNICEGILQNEFVAEKCSSGRGCYRTFEVPQICCLDAAEHSTTTHHHPTPTTTHHHPTSTTTHHHPTSTTTPHETTVSGDKSQPLFESTVPNSDFNRKVIDEDTEITTENNNSTFEMSFTTKSVSNIETAVNETLDQTEAATENNSTFEVSFSTESLEAAANETLEQTVAPPALLENTVSNDVMEPENDTFTTEKIATNAVSDETTTTFVLHSTTTNRNGDEISPETTVFSSETSSTSGSVTTLEPSTSTKTEELSTLHETGSGSTTTIPEEISATKLHEYMKYDIVTEDSNKKIESTTSAVQTTTHPKEVFVFGDVVFEDERSTESHRQ